MIEPEPTNYKAIFIGIGLIILMLSSYLVYFNKPEPITEEPQMSFDSVCYLDVDYEEVLYYVPYDISNEAIKYKLVANESMLIDGVPCNSFTLKDVYCTQTNKCFAFNPKEYLLGIEIKGPCVQDPNPAEACWTAINASMRMENEW